MHVRRALFASVFFVGSGIFCLHSRGEQAAHALPQAVPGSGYAAQLAIPPGLGYPFAKCELLGDAPRWLTLDCARLQLKGKVPAASAKDADLRLTLRVEDNAGNAREFPLSLRVSAEPQVVSLDDSPPPAPEALPPPAAQVAAAPPVHAAVAKPTSAENPRARAGNAPLLRDAALTEPAPTAGDEPGGDPPSKADAALARGSVAASTAPDSTALAADAPPAAAATKPQITSSQVPGSNGVSGTGKDGDTIQIQRSSGAASLSAKVADGTWAAPVPSTAPLKALETLTPSDGGSAGTAVTVQPRYRFGDDTHAIIGFQQVGASSAASTQKFFFDFYINRPVYLGTKHFGMSCQPTDPNVLDAASEDECDRRFHWWGNVRVASYPSTYTDPVASFAAAFIADVGKIPVNKLAQSAEFLTGLEYVIASSKYPVVSRSEETRERYSLALFAGFGATLPQDATDKVNYNIYVTPASGTPQYAIFNREFPGITSQYVAFVPPDRNLFYKQYLGGIRYTTHFADAETGAPLTSPPAMVSVGLGQNEQITQGVLRGVTARFSAFYPMPIGSKRSNSDWVQAFSGVYLFGEGQMRLSRPSVFPPLVLDQAPVGTNAYDAGVSLVPVRANRDLYMLGVGIDAIKVISSINKK